MHKSKATQKIQDSGRTVVIIMEHCPLPPALHTPATSSALQCANRMLKSLQHALRDLDPRPIRSIVLHLRVQLLSGLRLLFSVLRLLLLPLLALLCALLLQPSRAPLLPHAVSGWRRTGNGCCLSVLHLRQRLPTIDPASKTSANNFGRMVEGGRTVGPCWLPQRPALVWVLRGGRGGWVGRVHRRWRVQNFEATLRP